MTREKSRPVFAVQADQFAVQADGRRAGRQAEDGRPAGGVVLADQALDHQRHMARAPGRWWERRAWGFWCAERSARTSWHAHPIARQAVRSADLG